MDIQVVVLFPFRLCMISFCGAFFVVLILLVNDWSDPFVEKHNGSGCGEKKHLETECWGHGGFNMGVSENRGTPKSSILIGISIINQCWVI